MSTKQRKSLKAIAVFLAFAIAQVYVQLSLAQTALPGFPVVLPQLVVRLTTTGNQPITINGNSASTGATVLTNAIIETPPGVGATVNLGTLGSLDIAPGARVRLEYDCNDGPDNCKVKVTVLQGCVILHTRRGTHGQVDTEQQEKVAESNKSAAGLLDVCFGPNGVTLGQAANAGAGAAAGTGAAAGAGGGLSTGEIVAIVAGAGAVVGGTWWAFHHGGGNPSGTTP